MSSVKINNTLSTWLFSFGALALIVGAISHIIQIGNAETGIECQAEVWYRGKADCIRRQGQGETRKYIVEFRSGDTYEYVQCTQVAPLIDRCKPPRPKEFRNNSYVVARDFHFSDKEWKSLKGTIFYNDDPK